MVLVTEYSGKKRVGPLRSIVTLGITAYSYSNRAKMGKNEQKIALLGN
jgi:hypothetical protein